MLRIDLREGFDGDRVEISLDGRRERVEEDVRTRYQIGLARSIEIALPCEPCRVEICVPAKGARARIDVDSRRTPHLGVDLAPGGSLVLTPSEQPFGYV